MAAQTRAKWETEARERLRAAIRRYQKPLADLVARDANEGDTRMVVTEFLCEGFGFDRFNDLTTEYQVRGEFADYGIRLDGELLAFVEVKRAKTKLAARQLRQVEMYGVNEGVDWAILTNGVEWQLHHLGDRTPIEIDHVFTVDLLADGGPAGKADELFYLTRDSLKRKQIDTLWQARRATSGKSIAAAVMSDAVLEALRRELRRRTGQRVDAVELREILASKVIRTECV